MRLLVREFGRLVGALETTPDRGVGFYYDGAYLAEPEALVELSNGRRARKTIVACS